jgi:predicted regulator of Ras-like GTPase activity (Roadblock/LC7/MglB family)
MVMSRTERVVALLKNLHTNTPDVEAAALVSIDGLIMGSVLPSDIEEDKVAALSAEMFSLSERSSEELGRGTLNQVFVKGQGGNVILVGVGEEAVLTVLTTKNSKLGMILMDLDRTAKEIAQILY